MKTYTLAEFELINEQQKFPHIGLYDTEGKRLVAFNPHGKPVQPRIDRIKQTLINEALPDGIYILKTRESMSKGGASIDYPIVKGTGVPAELSEPAEKKVIKTEVHANNGASVNVLSYESAIELKVEVERLTMENGVLKQEIDDLTAECEELAEMLQLQDDDEQLSDGEKSGMESLAEMLENTMTVVSPMVDQHFKLKERKQYLEEMKFKTGYQPQVQHTSGTDIDADDEALGTNGKPVDERGINLVDEKVKEYISSYQEDETESDLYQPMVEVYNSAASYQDFCEKFEKEFGSERLQELSEFINSKGGTDE